MADGFMLRSIDTRDQIEIDGELSKLTTNVRAATEDLWAALMADYRRIPLRDLDESELRICLYVMQRILDWSAEHK